MKMLLALILFSTAVMAAEKPSYGVSVDEETKMVTLEVYNNDEAEVHCKYSVRYLVNTLTYKKQFGGLILAGRSAAAVSFANDKFDHISRVHAKVSCE